MENQPRLVRGLKEKQKKESVKSASKKFNMLKEKYQKEAISQMMKEFNKKNALAVPKILKVVINCGFGKMIIGKTSDEQKKLQNTILEDLAAISGQRPVLARAKKAIAGFKLREDLPIGAKVTLRKRMMYDFLERLINIVLPRTRDFQGIDSSSVDKNGNLTIGIQEHIVFPEISPEKAKIIFGLEITVVTNSKNKEEGLELFRLMGFPIKK